jgi:hypothetical protein
MTVITSHQLKRACLIVCHVHNRTLLLASLHYSTSYHCVAAQCIPACLRRAASATQTRPFEGAREGLQELSKAARPKGTETTAGEDPRTSNPPLLHPIRITVTRYHRTQTPIFFVQEVFRSIPTATVYQNEGAEATQTLGSSCAANSCDLDWVYTIWVVVVDSRFRVSRVLFEAVQNMLHTFAG